MAYRLSIVQPYVPRYRVPFFQRLVSELERDGIDCVVAAPGPEGAQAARGDAAFGEPWHLETTARSIGWHGRHATYLGSWDALRRSDAVVVPAAGTSVDAHLALFRKARSGLKVALWGHIDSYVSHANKLDTAVEGWQLRRSDLVLAYTERGAATAIRRGVKPNRVVAVQNTIDTDELEHARACISHSDITDFKQRWGLSSARVFAYFGGLDDSKRPQFLREMLDALWRTDPTIRFVIGGKGEALSLFAEAVRRGQVVLLGYVGATEKALIAQVAEALVCPGRIGLVAVDALSLGIPIVTTVDYQLHAPEVDYLVPGESLYSAPGDPERFAQYLHTRVPSRMERSTQTIPRLGTMVDRYRAGVLRMLNR